jgi:hypothetical protein
MALIMNFKQTSIITILVCIIFLFTGTGFCQDGKVSMEEWIKIIESKRKQKAPSENIPETIPDTPSRRSGKGTPVTVYWHMADDADVYLNGIPLRNYEPSFKTRRDEAPMPAFKAAAVIRTGDIFTVGGRRGGSYGFMLIATDSSGRIVFKTDPQTWRVYMPGDRTDWYQPAVAASSPSTPVTIQPDPWYPQKELNKQYGNAASSIWGLPSQTFAHLTATVSLPADEMVSENAEGVSLLTETFNSGLSSTWEPIQVVGGNFDRFATVGNGKLSVSVPAGNSWGKTGIMTSRAFFPLSATMAVKPLKLTFDFDADKTTGYVIALSQAKDADVWRVQNVWFHWGIPNPLEGKAYLVNTRNNADKGGESRTPPRAPESVTLAVRPGNVAVTTSDNSTITAGISWLKEGVPVYIYIFSHPWNQGESATFVLKSIRISQ